MKKILLVLLVVFSLLSCRTGRVDERAIDVAKEFVESLIRGDTAVSKSISIDYKGHRSVNYGQYLYYDVHDQIDDWMENQSIWQKSYGPDWVFEVLQSNRLSNDNYEDLKEAYSIIYKCKDDSYSSIIIGLDRKTEKLKVVDFEFGCRYNPGAEN